MDTEIKKAFMLNDVSLGEVAELLEIGVADLVNRLINPDDSMKKEVLNAIGFIVFKRDFKQHA